MFMFEIISKREKGSSNKTDNFHFTVVKLKFDSVVWNELLVSKLYNALSDRNQSRWKVEGWIYGGLI